MDCLTLDFRVQHDPHHSLKTVIPKMRQHMQLCSKFTAITRSQSNLSGATSDKATALLFIPRTKFSGACPHGLTSFLSQGPSLSHSTCQPASLPLQVHRPSFAQPLPSLQQALSLHRALAPTVLSLFCPQPGPSSRSHLAGIFFRKASSVGIRRGAPHQLPGLSSTPLLCFHFTLSTDIFSLQPDPEHHLE